VLLAWARQDQPASAAPQRLLLPAQIRTRPGCLQRVDQFNWMLKMQTAPLDFTANTQMALIYDREFEGPWVPQKV